MDRLSKNTMLVFFFSIWSTVECGEFLHFSTDLLAPFEHPVNMHNPFTRPDRSNGMRGDRFGQPINARRYSPSSMSANKRSSSVGGANGMWFGPRLGRVQKRQPSDAGGASSSSSGNQQTAELVSAMQGDH